MAHPTTGMCKAPRAGLWSWHLGAALALRQAGPRQRRVRSSLGCLQSLAGPLIAGKLCAEHRSRWKTASRAPGASWTMSAVLFCSVSGCTRNLGL